MALSQACSPETGGGRVGRPSGEGQGAVGSFSSSSTCPPPRPVPEQQPAQVQRGRALRGGGDVRERLWRACGVAGLTRVAVVEFVLQVAGEVLLHLSVGPVRVSIGVVAHKHAEEDHQGHLQEQAGDRQPPAEIGVPDHAAGGAWRGGQRAVRPDARRRERLIRPGQGRGGAAASGGGTADPGAARALAQPARGPAGSGLASTRGAPPEAPPSGAQRREQGPSGQVGGDRGAPTSADPLGTRAAGLSPFVPDPRQKKPDCLPPTEREERRNS